MAASVVVFVEDDALFHHLRDSFGSELRIEHGSALDAPSDCVVHAGNRFGIADGRSTVERYFVDHEEVDTVADEVARVIVEDWRGELPIGTAVLVPQTSNPNFRMVAYTPTSHAFHAVRGALVACWRRRDVRTVSMQLDDSIAAPAARRVLRHVLRAHRGVADPTQS